MNDVSVIDRFLDVFSRYIDSGFGLLGGEVAFLTATLVAIDMTLAGLFWAMSHASGQGDDVMAKLIRKVLYVGTFAYILSNFNRLAGNHLQLLCRTGVEGVRIDAGARRSCCSRGGSREWASMRGARSWNRSAT